MIKNNRARIFPQAQPIYQRINFSREEEMKKTGDVETSLSQSSCDPPNPASPQAISW
jgi:hypothetical protein